MEFFKNLAGFVRDVANDERIPDWDKKVVLGLVALLFSPFDIIPDWVPVFGQIDDVVIIALVLDYFFNVLDEEILLSHFPWSRERFDKVRTAARFVAKVTPSAIKTRLWTYHSQAQARAADIATDASGSGNGSANGSVPHSDSSPTA